MEETAVGCTRPEGGVVGQHDVANQTPIVESTNKETHAMIQVGKPAPDFVLPAYHQGTFTQVKLSDYLGKWVVLCFYPGDFTFV